jgi:ABC-type glycerol-3-phosphate transport system permease component
MRDCARRLTGAGVATRRRRRGELGTARSAGGDCHLPVLLLTVFAQRQIVAGLTAEALKGG